VKRNEQLKRALAELGIVVLGVMIALAADSWREDWLESRIEAGYLERLRVDVSAGLSVLEIERETYKSVAKSALALTGGIEENVQSVDDDYLVTNLIEATQMGFGRNEMASDITYRELVESGRLNLIRNHVIREKLVAYYRINELLVEDLIILPSVNDTFGELTGHYPIQVAKSRATLTAHDRARLLAAIREDPDFTAQLRLLHAQASFNDRQFAELIERAQELLSLLL
jgi:hypothetical protein